MDGFGIFILWIGGLVFGYGLYGLIESREKRQMAKRYERIIATQQSLLKETNRVNDELWEELSKRSEK